MRRAPVFELLESFSKVEWQQFKLFLKHKSGIGIDQMKVYNYIAKWKDDLSNSKLSIEQINKKLFPHLSRKVVQNIHSKLKTSIDQFLIQQELGKDKYINQYLLFKAMNGKGLYSRANKIAQQINNNSIDADQIDIWKYFNRWLLNHNWFFSLNPIKYSKEGPLLYEKVIHDFMNLNNAMKQFYKMEYKYVHSHTSIPIDTVALNEDGLLLERKQTEEEYLFQLINKSLPDNIQHINEIVKLMRRKHISYDLLAVSVFITINILNQHIRKGSADLMKQYVLLHELGFERKVFSVNGKISANTFHNYLRILLNLKMFDKAESFRNTYSSQISSKEQDDAVLFYQAQIHFFKNDFDLLIDLLSNKQFHSLNIRANSRELLIMSHLQVHSSAYDFLDSMISNHLEFINYHKKEFSLKSFQGRINLMKFIRMIVQNKSIPELEKFISNESILNRRMWAVSQLAKYKAASQ